MPGTGERVSILGFGAMRLPLLDPKDMKAIDEETATKMIRLAIDGGVNYVDSAYVYHGQLSEPVLGRALQGGYREKVFLATKLPTWMVGKPADMDRMLDEQLERMQTDKIDFYLIHSLNRDLWKKMKDLDFGSFLERAQKAGKITHGGFSFHGDRENFKEIVDGYDWSFCQIMFNYLDEEFQAGREGMEYAAAKGLGVVVMEPLRRSGTRRKGNGAPWSGRCGGSGTTRRFRSCSAACRRSPTWRKT
jgi:predicted aldo/keto reductase-like oxidoreductase